MEKLEHYWNCLFHHVAILSHVKLLSQGYTYPRSLVFKYKSSATASFMISFTNIFQLCPLQNNKLQILSTYALFRKKNCAANKLCHFKTISCKYGQSILFSGRKWFCIKIQIMSFSKQYIANMVKVCSFQKEKWFCIKNSNYALFRKTMPQIRRSKLPGLCPIAALGMYVMIVKLPIC